MDIEDFWNDIRFKPLYKERGMWIMGALIDSGIQVQLMVVSKTKAIKLVDMEWVLIQGIEPDGQVTRCQFFEYPPVLTKVLTCRSRDFKESKFMHDYEPYIIIRDHDPRMLDTVQYEDRVKLMDLVVNPGFKIKRVG